MQKTPLPQLFLDALIGVQKRGFAGMDGSDRQKKRIEGEIRTDLFKGGSKRGRGLFLSMALSPRAIPVERTPFYPLTRIQSLVVSACACSQRGELAWVCGFVEMTSVWISYT